jgi:hypothetical protein
MRRPPPPAIKDTPQPFHFKKNAFNVLATEDSDEDTADTVPTQMAALTYQSQLTAATAANASQRMDQYVQTLAQEQEQLQQSQHQIMEQLAALTLNHGEGGRGVGRQGRPHPPPPTPFAPNQLGCHNFGYRGGQGRGRGCGRGHGLPVFMAGHTTPPMSITTGRIHKFPAPHTPGSRGYFSGSEARKCKPFSVIATALDPTFTYTPISNITIKDDDITVVTSNVSDGTSITYQTVFSASALTIQSSLQAVFTITPNDAIADSGATQIFVMEGTPVLNK